MSGKIAELERKVQQAATRIERVDALNALVRQIWRQYPTRATALSEEAQKIAAIEPIYSLGLATALLNIGRCHYRLARYSDAQDYVLQALASYQAENYPSGEGYAWAKLGLIHWRLADYPTASEYHLRALEIFQAIGDNQGVAEALTNMGLVYALTGDTKATVTTFSQLLELYQESGDRLQQGFTLNRLAMTYWRAGELSQARECAEQSMQIARQEANKALEASVLDTCGAVLLAQGQAEEALSYFQRSIQISTALGYKHDELIATMNMGRAYAAVGQTEDAIITWQQALEMARLIEAKEELRRCHRLMADFFKERGNLAEALSHFEQYHELDKAIFNETAEMRLRTLQVYHAAQATQQRNEALEKEMAERLQIEAALRASRESLYTLIQASPDSIYFKDAQGRWQIANHAGLALFELTGVDYVGRTDVELAEETPFFREALHHCMKTDNETWQKGQMRRTIEFVPQRDGNQRTFDVIKVPLCNEIGERQGLVILGRDVTAQHAMEEALQASEERLRLMVQHMPVLVDALDETGNIVFWNKECERVTGYSAAEIVGNPRSMELLYPDAGYRQMMLKKWVEAGNNYRDWEWDITCKDGSRKTIAWSNISAGFPLPGWVAWGIGVDVTERLKAEAALRLAQKMESLGVLAGGVAHDFNNLLVAMLGQMSLALARLRPDNQARTHVEKAVKAAERAADLTQKMLAYSGRGHFSIQPLDLNALIAENLNLFQTSIPKHVQLCSDLMMDLPLIEADPGQIQQVVMNLILNGAEAIGKRPGQIFVQTQVLSLPLQNGHDAIWGFPGQPLAPGKYVALLVQDDGIGMNEETLAKIFDPFFTTKQNGHGLGLAAVLGIMRGHKGAIRVESKPGVGTTFRLLFPTSAAVPKMAERQTAVSAPQLPDAKILVIDDEPLVCETIADILAVLNVTILSASDGHHGLAIYREQMANVHLVILDLSMPGMNGIETLRQLREINPHVRVLLISGYSRIEATREPGLQNLAGFMQKPFNADDLLQTVTQILFTKVDHQSVES